MFARGYNCINQYIKDRQNIRSQKDALRKLCIDALDTGMTPKKYPNHGHFAVAIIINSRHPSPFGIRLCRALFDLIDHSFDSVFDISFVWQTQLERTHESLCANQ